MNRVIDKGGCVILLDKPKHILVPVDGSPASSYAASYAGMLQKQFDCSVTLVHVYGYPIQEEVTAKLTTELLLEESKTAGMQILEKDQASAFAADAHVSTMLIEGNDAQVIIDLTKGNEYDLVVMGSQGIGSLLKRLFVGSVTQQVIREVEIPVVVLRAPKD